MVKLSKNVAAEALWPKPRVSPLALPKKVRDHQRSMVALPAADHAVDEAESLIVGAVEEAAEGVLLEIAAVPVELA
jgi:hypothetical protein